MAVVDPREVVKECVLEEGSGVDSVHEDVEGCECCERGDDEGESGAVEEVEDGF